MTYIFIFFLGMLLGQYLLQILLDYFKKCRKNKWSFESSKFKKGELVFYNIHYEIKSAKIKKIFSYVGKFDYQLVGEPDCYFFKEDKLYKTFEEARLDLIKDLDESIDSLQNQKENLINILNKIKNV